MFGPAIDALLTLIGTYGAVVLLGIFLLEGALVGKLIPTRTLFVAAVLAVGVEAVAFLPMVAAAVVGATIGQSLLFVSVRRFDVDPAELSVVPGDGDQFDAPSRWLNRWGLPAVAVSNAIPGIRGWLAVPTAGSSVSAPRFVAASFAGSVVYASALLAVALGVGGAYDHIADSVLVLV